MDDGKPTGPKAKWWSRPTPGRDDRGEPEGVSPVADAEDAASAPGAPEPADDVAVERPATADERSAPAGPPARPAEEPPRPAAAMKPLHEPDEYSTPPYGGPGPWAPAPPVQRPVPTPAHGTPVPPQYTGTHAAPTAVDPGPPPGPVPGGTQTQTPPQHLPPHQQPQHPGPHGPQLVTQQVPHQQTGQQAPSQWLQYDPWGAQRQPLTQQGPPLGTEPAGRRKSRRGTVLIGAVLLAVVAGGIGGGIGAYIERNGGLTSVELPQAGRDNGGRAPDSVAGIAASALPSVVTLHVSGSAESGTGTGFVLDDKGHILTNNHVVSPAGSSGDITVTFSGGETAAAEIVGKDSGYDLAVVKVTGVSGLKPLPLGNSDNVQVGDPVVAIGAPFDLSNTVTSGIISAKQRPITAGGREGRRHRHQLCRRAPDRCPDQPRQLRRPAGRRPGPCHRHQQRHPRGRHRRRTRGRPVRFHRPRLRHTDQPGQAGRRGADQHGQGDPPRDRRHPGHEVHR
ncbi:hypothetical protein ACVWXU_003574 [Streptomyces sp. TE33382]